MTAIMLYDQDSSQEKSIYNTNQDSQSLGYIHQKVAYNP
jgi:hypothetical protein